MLAWMSPSALKFAVFLVASILSMAPPLTAQDAGNHTEVVARRHGVDIALVLAVDVSSSIQSVERTFQRRAYAEALKDPRVADIALGGGTGRVAIAYMEWSGHMYQRVHLPIRIMTSAEELAAFADDILSIRDHPSDPMYFQATAVGDALIAADVAMSELSVPARDYVIDISGDGVLNDGSAMPQARDHVLARGYVVNGLPIEVTGSPSVYDDTASSEHVSRYYADCVIGGPGSFHLIARGFSDIRDTLIMKLMLEMAELPATRKRAIAEAWNRGHPEPDARIIPAMVLDLTPNNGSAPEDHTDCSAHEMPVFVP